MGESVKGQASCGGVSPRRWAVCPRGSASIAPTPHPRPLSPKRGEGRRKLSSRAEAGRTPRENLALLRPLRAESARRSCSPRRTARRGARRSCSPRPAAGRGAGGEGLEVQPRQIAGIIDQGCEDGDRGLKRFLGGVAFPVRSAFLRSLASRRPQDVVVMCACDHYILWSFDPCGE